MRHHRIYLRLLGALIIAGGIFAQPAQAGISISIGNGHHYGHHNHSNHYSHNYKRKHYYKRSYSRKHNHHGYGYSNQHRSYKKHHGYKKHVGRYDCHAVTKWAHDDYGRKLKIGGTMCYDAYGRSYVVPGSRYVITQY